MRGLLHAAALFPLRDALLRMGSHGGLVVALLVLVLGQIAGVTGSIEQALYTTIFDLRLTLTHLPEIVVQTLLFGYLLIAWECRADRARRSPTTGQSIDQHDIRVAFAEPGENRTAIR